MSRRHLAEVAAGLELGKYLLLGRGEERSGGRTKTALLANAMEAVIGAVYLDAGLEAARRLIEARVIAPMVDSLREQLTAGGGMGDFKSALQELLQARKQGQPEYRTTGETGRITTSGFLLRCGSALRCWPRARAARESMRSRTRRGRRSRSCSRRGKAE